MKRPIYTSLFFILMLNVTHAQNEVVRFFPAAAVPNGGNANVHNLVKGYITPIAEDFGMIINNGWFTTPVVHQRWGFDLSVSVTTVSISSDAKSFSIPALSGLTNTGTGEAPTAYGSQSVFPSFTYNDGSNSGLSFRGPDGANVTDEIPVGSLAVPTLQFGMGVLKDTDLRIRYSPTVNIHDVEFGNWGVAVMHDFKRFIPGFVSRNLSLSVFAGYTQMKATTDLSGIYTGSAQQGVAKSTGITTQVLLGKEFFKVVTVYAGVGYNYASTDYDINGTYNVTTTDANVTLATPVTLTNPFSDSYSKNSVRSTAGIRLRLGPVAINSDFTVLNDRSLLTAGLGVTIR